MANKTLLMKRSQQVEENGLPKLPTPDQLDYGELAINYAEGKETISFKNSANNIVCLNQEVEIGTTPSEGEVSLAKIIIDESVDPLSVDVYSKEQIDTQVDALEAVDSQLRTDVNNKVLRGNESATEQSTLLVDESASVEYEVYTKAQVDAIIAQLKADNNLK